MPARWQREPRALPFVMTQPWQPRFTRRVLAGASPLGKRPDAGLVNFSAYSPRISRLAARQGTDQTADLPGSGSYPLNRHGQRCYGPLPFSVRATDAIAPRWR